MNHTKKMFGAIFVLSVLAFLLAPSSAPAADLSELKYPKLNEIKIPQVEKVTLKNGMTLMLVEDHELPVINFKALIRAGTIYEPEAQVGLTDLMSQAWRTGGTTSKTGDEIDEILESLGASIEGSVSKTSAELNANTLTESLDTVLNLFADILMNPAFSEDKVELARMHLRSAIARRNDEPMGILMREYPKLVYGARSPYARQYEYENVDDLSRDGLLAFHGKYFHPNAVILGVWGDFKTSEMKKKVEKAFAKWNEVRIEYPRVADVDLAMRPSVNYVEKTDIEQCFVILGHMGMRLDDPDYPSFYVMNEILGGGWSSRIFNKVRTEKGLAYAAGGGLMAQYGYPGPFYAFSSTKFASTHEAISTMIDEIRRIREEEVTDTEIQVARDAYLNSFAFQFDSVGKILGRIMTYQYYGYPEDFLQKTRAAIEKVTKQDILGVAKARLHPDHLIILAVGDASKFDKSLSSFGTVNTVDITIPEPEETLPEVTDAASQRGTEIMSKALAAMGGAEKILSIEATSSVFKATMNTPAGEFALDVKSIMAYPDRMYLEMQTPMGLVSQVLNKDAAWMQTPQGMVDLQGSQIEELKTQIQFDLVTVLKRVAAGTATAQYLGETELDGRKVFDVIVAVAERALIHLYVDTSDYLVAGNMRRATTIEGPAEVTEVYSDTRDVSGVKVSFASVQRTPAKQISSALVSQFEINPAVDVKLFEKPQK